MLFRLLVELLAPAECLSCGNQGDWLCVGCVASLPAYPATQERWPGVAGASVAVHYRGPVKALIKKLKFERSRSAADVAARLLLSRAVLPPDVDIVTAVPIAPSRYRERGYNQAELIAKRVAVQLGLPYRSLLGRENADHQIGRGRQERLEHIQGAFFATGRLAGRRVLIVDDVMTTGATLAECAVVLGQAGAEAVWVTALARR